MRPSTLLLAGAAAALLPMAARAETVKLQLMPTGLISTYGDFQPHRLELSPVRPAGIKKLPAGLVSPLFGVMKVGAREHPKKFFVALSEPAGKPARLYVDSNGDGDLTNDKPSAIRSIPYRTAAGMKHLLQGFATIEAPLDGTKAVQIGIMRFDPTDPQRLKYKDSLLYGADYAYTGAINLGGHPYKVLLADLTGAGDFRGQLGKTPSGVQLFIDVNGNGRFDSRGESYDIGKPFNIAGTTYEIDNMAANGASFDIVKSAQTVAEITPPADLGAGKNAVTFDAKTLDGTPVHFPADYKGKLVLLDFWATWCAPCRGEIPYVVKAYNAYHDKGFEVLGISLDQAKAGPKVASFTTENKMAWPQVYDGKYWAADVAQLYGVESIPHAYLIDGTTGKIVAEGDAIRGEALSTAVAKALAAH